MSARMSEVRPTYRHKHRHKDRLSYRNTDRNTDIQTNVATFTKATGKKEGPITDVFNDQNLNNLIATYLDPEPKNTTKRKREERRNETKRKTSRSK